MLYIFFASWSCSVLNIYVKQGKLSVVEILINKEFLKLRVLLEFLQQSSLVFEILIFMVSGNLSTERI